MKYARPVFAVVAAALLLIPLRSAAGDGQLAPIQIAPERRQLIGIRTAVVERKDVSDEVDATATIQPDEELQSYVQTRFSGWIDQVYANQTYASVKKGQPLFTIYSPDLVSTEQEYLLALAARDRAQESKIEGVSGDAETLVDAAGERLRLWNVSPREISRLEREHTPRRSIEIDSPVSGYVVERNALPGMYVQPDSRLFAITDLSRVWAYAAVFQNDLAKVKVGDPAELTINTGASREYGGRVTFIWPEVDQTTRTAKVRVEFENADHELVPGMFGRISLKAPLGEQTVIPDSAVLRAGTRNLAFVDQGNGTIVPVEVDLGAHVGNEFVVVRGLRPGQTVVSSANFLLDSESQLQAAAGNYVPPPSGVGANAPTAESKSQVSIELNSDPSTPARGHNTFTVKVRDSNGKAIKGASVTVTFYMAAMPAMGMAAMRDQASLEDQGEGQYSGAIELQSGGTWSVTIAATRNGQPLGSKQLDVSVTGPMSM